MEMRVLVNQILGGTPKKEWRLRNKEALNNQRKFWLSKPGNQKRLNAYKRKYDVQTRPLQERSWWCLLTEQQQHLFLTEFNPEKHTIKEFREYLSQLPGKPKECRKLTHDQIREIRKALANGIHGVDPRHLGGHLVMKYGVSRQAINDIKNWKTYKKVV
jgi:hypothetical protein